MAPLGLPRLGAAEDMLLLCGMALGYNDVTAYLTMMAPRLVELHRAH